MIPYTPPPTRAEKRRAKREADKAPKYGPVVIWKEVHERVEGGKNVTFKKSYQGRTNIKQN